MKYEGTKDRPHPFPQFPPYVMIPAHPSSPPNRKDGIRRPFCLVEIYDGSRTQFPNAPVERLGTVTEGFCEAFQRGN